MLVCIDNLERKKLIKELKQSKKKFIDHNQKALADSDKVFLE
jgi:hypothetical protein